MGDVKTPWLRDSGILSACHDNADAVSSPFSIPRTMDWSVTEEMIGPFTTITPPMTTFDA